MDIRYLILLPMMVPILTYSMIPDKNLLRKPDPKSEEEEEASNDTSFCDEDIYMFRDESAYLSFTEKHQLNRTIIIGAGRGAHADSVGTPYEAKRYDKLVYGNRAYHYLLVDMNSYPSHNNFPDIVGNARILGKSIQNKCWYDAIIFEYLPMGVSLSDEAISEALLVLKNGGKLIINIPKANEDDIKRNSRPFLLEQNLSLKTRQLIGDIRIEQISRTHRNDKIWPRKFLDDDEDFYVYVISKNGIHAHD